MSLEQKLERVVAHYDELRDAVAAHPEPGSAAYARMLKDFADLTPVVEQITALRAANQQLAEAEALMEDPSSDSEMRALAEEEYYALKERVPTLEQQVKIMLLPKDEADERNVILEVRAGTGGEEGFESGQLDRA